MRNSLITVIGTAASRTEKYVPRGTLTELSDLYYLAKESRLAISRLLPLKASTWRSVLSRYRESSLKSSVARRSCDRMAEIVAASIVGNWASREVDVPAAGLGVIGAMNVGAAELGGVV